MPDLNTLGERVSYLRTRRGWTQKKLAEEAGLSTTFISEIENDKRNVGMESLLQLAEALGTSLDFLAKGLEGAEEVSRSPVVLPPELADAAEQQGWSVGHARDLLKAQSIVISRRTKEKREHSGTMLSQQDWIEFHRRLFGD